MEISSASSVAALIAQRTAAIAPQQAAMPVQSAQPLQHLVPASVTEPDAAEALTYTLDQLRTARIQAQQTGAIKGTLLNVYA